MDKYQKLKAVQGLIISLDEQIYRLDQKNDNGIDIYDTVTNKYYDSILEFLQKEDYKKNIDKQEFVNSLCQRGIITEQLKQELLNEKT